MRLLPRWALLHAAAGCLGVPGSGGSIAEAAAGALGCRAAGAESCQKAGLREEIEQRREEARRKRFDDLLEKVKDLGAA